MHQADDMDWICVMISNFPGAEHILHINRQDAG